MHRCGLQLQVIGRNFPTRFKPCHLVMSSDIPSPQGVPTGGRGPRIDSRARRPTDTSPKTHHLDTVNPQYLKQLGRASLYLRTCYADLKKKGKEKHVDCEKLLLINWVI